jgi:anthranilate phosphoribosyltransferase
LMIGGKVGDLKAGADLAAKAIDTGLAKETLARLVTISNSG